MNFALLALAASAGLFILTVVLPIVTFLRARKAVDDIKLIETRLATLETELKRVQVALQRAISVQPKPSVPPEATPAPAPVPSVLPLSPLSVTPSAPPPVPAPIAPVEVARPEPVAAAEPVARPGGRAASVEATRPAAPRPALEGTEESLESRIGGRWLLYIGTAALVLGIGFFVKYAFDNNWITETGRVLIGAAIGLVMILGGDRLARRGYPLYGQIVAGGGFAALYISVFAALSFYGLIGRPTAFGLMVVITAAAALAADRHRSQGLAVFAVVGGFLTPFLVGGGENAQVVLLSYDTLLALGTMVMADRRAWPLLNAISYVFATFTFAGWWNRFYTPGQYIPTQIFLTIFGALFTWIGMRARRSRQAMSDVALLLLTAPLVFHAASVANLQQHWMALLVYLTLFSVTAVAASVKLDSAWLRLAGFALTAPVLWVWIGQHAGPGWRLAPAAVALAIYAMNLVAMGERLSRQPERWLKADLLLFHVNALGLFGGLYAIFDPVATAWMPALALAIAIFHCGLMWAWRTTSEEAALNSLAVAFAMVGFAIGLQFDQWWAVVGWAVEAAAIVWVGLKARRDWMRVGGALLLGWTLVRLEFLGFFELPAGFSPVFNARVGATLVIVAICYLLAMFHRRYGQRMSDRAGPEIAAFYILANVITIVLLTTEISFYWRMREDTDAAARLARSASVSVAWAIYGTALIVVGIVRRYAPVRYLAIALLALTVVKAFLSDLSMLGGIYRIIGFIGLGVFLLLGAWLYQRYRDVILGKD